MSYPSRRSAASQGRKYRQLPQMEALESRWVPSCVVSQSGNTLTIVGDNYDNEVHVRVLDSSQQIEVECDGHTWSFDSYKIKKIDVNLKAGDDSFSFELQGGSDYQYLKDLKLELGKGDDTALIDLFHTGSSSSAHLYNKFNASINAGDGEDHVDVNLGAIEGAQVCVNANLGRGDDRFNGAFNGDLTGRAKAKLDVRGQGGDDHLIVTANEDLVNHDGSGIDIDEYACMDVSLDGGDTCNNERYESYRDDEIYFTYRGELDGQLKLREYGRYGDDYLYASITTDEDSYGRLDAELCGGQGDDHIYFYAYPSDYLHHRLWADGAQGSDDAHVTDWVHTKSCETVEEFV
jgi:hypothetical protein